MNTVDVLKYGHSTVQQAVQNLPDFSMGEGRSMWHLVDQRYHRSPCLL